MKHTDHRGIGATSEEPFKCWVIQGTGLTPATREGPSDQIDLMPLSLHLVPRPGAIGSHERDTIDSIDKPWQYQPIMIARHDVYGNPRHPKPFYLR